MKNCNLFAVGIIVGAIAVSALCADKTVLPAPPKCDRKKACNERKPQKPKCEECCYQIYYR